MAVAKTHTVTFDTGNTITISKQDYDTIVAGSANQFFHPETDDSSTAAEKGTYININAITQIVPK